MSMLPVWNAHTAYWELSEGFVKEFEEEPPEEYLEQVRCRGGGIYFTVNELGEQRNKNGNLRNRENVTSLLACFTDFDTGTKDEQRTRLKTFLEPSCIVESGRGYHAYWTFPKPVGVELEALWVQTQKALALKLGGDGACSDVARLMRLPGSFHAKPGFESTRVKIVFQSGKTYTLEELLKSLDEKPKVKTFFLPTRYSPLKIPPIPKPLCIGERHAALLSMAGSLFRGSAPREVGERMQVLKAWYVASCDLLKKDWEKEVEAVVEWVTLREHGQL